MAAAGLARRVHAIPAEPRPTACAAGCSSRQPFANCGAMATVAPRRSRSPWVGMARRPWQTSHPPMERCRRVARSSPWSSMPCAIRSSADCTRVRWRWPSDTGVRALITPPRLGRRARRGQVRFVERAAMRAHPTRARPAGRSCASPDRGPAGPPPVWLARPAVLSSITRSRTASLRMAAIRACKKSFPSFGRSMTRPLEQSMRAVTRSGRDPMTSIFAGDASDAVFRRRQPRLRRLARRAVCQTGGALEHRRLKGRRA